jgi:Domain of unknown function (DUF4112)
MKQAPREIEVEVLPKDFAEGAGSADGLHPPLRDPLIDFIARLMDSMFSIPGTKIRFGLDPLIGLIPGFGSPISAAVSLFLIARSARYRVPRIVLARMALNVLINAGLDAVPVVGDLLSIFYRSNAQNYELLRKHAGTSPASTRADWLFVSLLIGGLALVLLLICLGLFTLLTLAATAVEHWTHPHP